MKGTVPVLLMTLAAVGVVNASNAQGSGCRAPDAWSEDGVAHLRDIVRGTSPSAAFLRTRLSIDASDTTEVYQVTVDSICTRAAQARATVLGDDFDGEPAYVYRMGTQYVVDEEAPDGYSPMLVLDSLFHEVGWIGR